MIEWLQNLAPEFYITVGGILFLALISFVQLYRLNRIANKVGEQEFYMKELLQIVDGLTYLHLTVINKSFSSNQINMISIARRNISKTLEEKTIMIAPRSKYNTNFLLDDLKPFVYGNRKSYKKFKIHVENEIGLRKSLKPKNANKYLRKEFNNEKKQIRLENKKKRFEHGTYTFVERVGLIVGLLFRPFRKMFQSMAYSTNKALKESEIRRQQKREHNAIKYKLEETEAQLNSIRIKEDAMVVNKTRETELELLKKEKEYALEKLKKTAMDSAYMQAKKDIISRDVEQEAAAYFNENPINFDVIEKDDEADIDLETKKELNDNKEIDIPIPVSFKKNGNLEPKDDNDKKPIVAVESIEESSKIDTEKPKIEKKTPRKKNKTKKDSVENSDEKQQILE